MTERMVRVFGATCIKCGEPADVYPMEAGLSRFASRTFPVVVQRDDARTAAQIAHKLLPKCDGQMQLTMEPIEETA